MIPEIFTTGMKVLFVGTAVPKISDDLGFYHLGQKDKFWWYLQYSGLAGEPVIDAKERKLLLDTFKTHALNDIYRQIFFEKKARLLTAKGIGLTVINRREIVTDADDPAAMPTPGDVRELIGKIRKLKPRAVAFLTEPALFESCLKPQFAGANRRRGRQDFTIGTTEVWLLGNTDDRSRDAKVLEKVFEELGTSL